MLSYDFDSSIGYWILRAAQCYERALSEKLLPEGITYRQCQVLGWLALDGDLSQTELADRMRVEPPTLVGILDRMEREGWVNRHNCPNDRRRKIIRPGPEAEPNWNRITAVLREVRAQAVRGMSEAESAELHRLLVKVQENLAAPEPVKVTK